MLMESILRAILPDAKTVKLAANGSIGRQHQPNLFELLVPNHDNLCVISRNHCSVLRAENAWLLKTISMNPVKVNHRVLTQSDEAVLLTNGMQISFLPRTHAQDLSASPFLQFSVLLPELERMNVAAVTAKTKLSNLPQKGAPVVPTVTPASLPSGPPVLANPRELVKSVPKGLAEKDVKIPDHFPPCFVCIHSECLNVQKIKEEDRCVRIRASKFGRQHQTRYVLG